MRRRILLMSSEDNIHPAFEPFNEVAEIVTIPPDRDAFKEAIREADAYFASMSIRLDREILQEAKRLRVIATASTGLDHIDLKVAEEMGVTIISLKEEIEFLNDVTATAEMAWTLMLAVFRKLPSAFDWVKSGHWRATGGRYRGHQISGKTLGVLGYGRLGRMMAEYGKAFRMRVIACDTKAIEPPPGVTMVDFETLIAESDVLTIHIHLTEKNRNLIRRNEFQKMKPGAVLVNTSRGAIIDETAFLEALETNHLGGAGIDVIDGEWNDDFTGHPLIRYANTHDNLVISPHIGGVTYESQQMAITFIVNKLMHFLQDLDNN